MSNVFFDLDGTLINSQYRLYNLFVELCPECKMTYEEYWEIKRQRINQTDFLKKYFNYSDEKYTKFHKIWLEKVEEPERLRQDFLNKGCSKLLEVLSQKHSLYLATNRQSKELTISELEAFDIRKYFKDSFITEQKIKKEELIKQKVNLLKTDIFVGDTGEDINCAKVLGIKSIAVTWGILNKNILKEYCPDIIIDEVKELERYLLQF